MKLNAFKIILFSSLSVFLTQCIPNSNKNSLIPEVEELLAQMTLEEKIGQLTLMNPGGNIPTGSVVNEDVEAKIKKGWVGGLFGISGPEKIRKMQELAVNETRLGIPLLFGYDVIHGYKTTFPIPLGLASTWDMDLIERSAQIAAQEATADGVFWNFSPMVDVSRDPRWGRISEGAGEDPFLGSAIARAMVNGYQQDDLSATNTMMACVKHFALYGASEAGRDYNNVSMDHVTMYNDFLPPYKAAIDAGVGSVMSGFNDIEGIPASGNKWLLTEILRDDWGFDGFVTSDYTSINEMINHGLGDAQTVAALALNAGMDMDMVGQIYLGTLAKSVEEGKVNEEDVTHACRRILEAKYKLGLFDDPYLYLDDNRPEKEILTKENRKVARDVAGSSFVLMKKDAGVLPVSKTAKIALIGPLVDSRNNMLGTWAPTGDPEYAVTILEGFKNVAPEANIQFAKGANIHDDSTFAQKINVFGTRIDIDERSPVVLLDEAIKIARNSDVVVAVVGEATEMSGESSSRSNIQIPESQKQLIRALVKMGKPVALILMSGRPLDISEEAELPMDILQVWHPGVEAGNAIADAVFGDINPSGKLTASWPRNVGQIPVYHSQKYTGRPQRSDSFQKFTSNYLDVANSPLFPFGHGLSYTTFEYSNLKLSADTIDQGEAIEVTLDLKNIGQTTGAEVVQLYLRDVARTITPPKRQLKGFQKVELQPGESKSVTLTLSADDLKFYNYHLNFVAEPGVFEVFVGTNSDAELRGEFVLN